MPDAIPAPHASACAQPPIPTPPGGQNQPATTSPLLSAAQALLPALEAGRALDAPTLRAAMIHAFGASDAHGAWVWKDAYEAAEAALVLFLQRYGHLMRRDSAAGGPAAMLTMLERLAALEPSHTRRSEQQIAFQQFSTPLPLAYAALQAAAIRPSDTVLEPSAGTGMLAVMAECALGDRAAGALHLNELAAERASLLAALFPDAPLTRHNAEAIADHLPGARPHRRPHESAVLGLARHHPDPPRRRSAPPAFGLHSAPDRRAPNRHHLRQLHPRATTPGAMPSRTSSARRGVLHHHRRARLCP